MEKTLYILYIIYIIYSSDPRTISILTADNDYSMPETYYRTIGATVRGFSFVFPKSSKTIQDNFIPANNLLNIKKWNRRNS